ncbi:MAG: hypothetical protein LAT58_08315 [Opitutales bacterium]|nr:hypothetical protein [Opitutales bacterium]
MALNSNQQQALRIADRMTRYLFANQVNLRKIAIEPQQELRRDITFTRNGPAYTFSFQLQNDTLEFVDSLGRSKSVPPQKPFRLNPFPDPVQNDGLPKPETITLPRKVWKAGKRIWQESTRLLRHFILGGWDTDTKALWRDFYCDLKRPRADTEGGFLAIWHWEGKKALIEIIDHGGILDDNPNTEALAYAPRVMANYYADTYAAYNFVQRYRHTKDQEYLQAAHDALRFMMRTYEGYPPGIAWYHHEFKNPGFLETIIALEEIGEEVQPYRSFVQNLRLDRYEPTNVHALRHYWKTLQQKFSAPRDRKRLQASERRLAKDQTRDGLILDNNYPAYTCARDLTYHQYSLACLAGSLSCKDNSHIREIFLRGCQFTLNLRLPNGEVSYNGRGANNIYHVASAIYALAFAQDRYQFKVNGFGPMMELLEKWFLPDNSLPTAMNKFSAERVMWNHCRSPYNALSAFLLYKAAACKMQEDERSDPQGVFLYEDSGYGVIRKATHTSVIFSGKKESYPYSGTYTTGISGLAAYIETGAKERKNPILGRCLRHGGKIYSDLPEEILRKKKAPDLISTKENKINLKIGDFEAPYS